MSVAILIAIFATLFLGFSNGANDNFKGVATLLGTKTASHNMCLIWATMTTLAGSLVAMIIAQKLLVGFSGKGLVPDAVIHLPAFALTVALAGALTVFLATRFGFPISTTHALIGALVGCGFVASPAGINFNNLVDAFLLPLLLSPIIATALAVIFYPLLSRIRRRVGVRSESCLCIGKEVLMPLPAAMTQGAAVMATLQLDGWPQLAVGTTVSCENRYQGNVVGLEAKTVLDSIHFLSAGAVSFARGLNDTPKIAALLMLISATTPTLNIFGIAIAIALGGLIFTRRIAETMAYQITEMNEGQGLTANLITSAVVLGASNFGIPVSTTHVSCGALFGIGAVSHKAHWKTVLKIVTAWLTTLPLAAALGALLFLLGSKFI